MPPVATCMLATVMVMREPVMRMESAIQAPLMAADMERTPRMARGKPPPVGIGAPSYRLASSFQFLSDSARRDSSPHHFPNRFAHWPRSGVLRHLRRSSLVLYGDSS